MYKSI